MIILPIVFTLAVLSGCSSSGTKDKMASPAWTELAPMTASPTISGLIAEGNIKGRLGQNIDEIRILGAKSIDQLSIVVGVSPPRTALLIIARPQDQNTDEWRIDASLTSSWYPQPSSRASVNGGFYPFKSTPPQGPYMSAYFDEAASFGSVHLSKDNIIAVYQTEDVAANREGEITTTSRFGPYGRIAVRRSSQGIALIAAIHHNIDDLQMERFVDSVNWDLLR